MSVTEESAEATAIRPFTVDIPEAEIEALRARVVATRWPSKELVSRWVAGRAAGDAAGARALLGGRLRLAGCVEARLNALPQFTTEIDGVEIHFIHVKSGSRERAAADHHARLARLGDRDARGRRPAHRPNRARRGAPRTRSTWCCRPCPATGSPASLAEVGWDACRVAQAWAELMLPPRRTCDVAQGGDQGAGVTDAMGRQAPDGLLGVHFNFPGRRPVEKLLDGSPFLTLRALVVFRGGPRAVQ